MSELRIVKFSEMTLIKLGLRNDKLYFKAEVDKVIAHQKYKRCLAMAHGCEYLCAHYQFREVYKKRDFFRKWMFRWLELAEKFKE